MADQLSQMECSIETIINIFHQHSVRLGHADKLNPKEMKQLVEKELPNFLKVGCAPRRPDAAWRQSGLRMEDGVQSAMVKEESLALSAQPPCHQSYSKLDSRQSRARLTYRCVLCAGPCPWQSHIVVNTQQRCWPVKSTGKSNASKSPKENKRACYGWRGLGGES